jgi:superfamily II DNA/RNA helicase
LTDDQPARDLLAEKYLDSLPYTPYPVQEEALLTWFTSHQGVLVCAPTGTGKTLIAEAALFEALHTGRRAYYTTPLIALTEQKLAEMQAAAVRWGFGADDVGLVTGNRQVNPQAPVLVVVAEILFNRLLHGESFQFDDVAAVVMDEFHSFNDPERGVVWELSLGLLPPHVRLLLLSATVGNSMQFINWLEQSHDRRLQLVESDERKVPLSFHWVGDQLLVELLEEMAVGEPENRRVPALVFCFNREECWTVAEQLKGKGMLAPGQQAALASALERHDWSSGAGPKLRQILMRGVGVHHAGVLPRYKRIVEDLFQQKLLSVTVCTETLAAGINLPARSVVVPNLLKGPPDKKRLIEASAAHQMFGRAGRPQFDTQGHVYALAHEDDVKILRWREKYDQIPEDTKDPQLRKAKKALKKKMPTRRANQQYWNQAQFEKLTAAPPGNLQSRGGLPWRLLAYMLDASPEVEPIRRLVGKRLMFGKRLEAAQRDLEHMLMTLWAAGYVKLDPEPPRRESAPEEPATEARSPADGPPATVPVGLTPDPSPAAEPVTAVDAGYKPLLAVPTPELGKLLMLRGINPLYGVFLVNQLGIANRAERLQAFESVLELPRSVGRFTHVPPPDVLSSGPLATTRLDPQLLHLGLATPEELGAGEAADEPDRHALFPEERVFALRLADKLRLLFDHDFPGVRDVRTAPVWAAGELLELGGDFNLYVTSKRMQKQEGVVFRHLLRLILLLGEFTQFCPPETDPAEWCDDLRDMQQRLIQTCRQVDPTSTDKVLEQQAELA